MQKCLKLKKEGITGNIVAAGSRDDPGLGEAQRTSCQTPVGGVVLLNEFPVTPSAHSTSLSSHPVWNLNLGETAASVGALTATRMSQSRAKPPWDCSYYLQSIQVEEDLTQTVSGSKQSDALILLCNANGSWNLKKPGLVPHFLRVYPSLVEMMSIITIMIETCGMLVW